MKIQTFLRRFPYWQQILAVGSIFGHLFLETATSLATTNSLEIESGRILLSLPPMKLTPQLIAGADNFNPALKLLPPTKYISPPPPPPNPVIPPGDSSKSVESKPKSATATVPFAVLENIQPNIRTDWNNSGQVNRFIESTAILRLNNGDRLLFTTGHNTYEQPGAKTVTNIPLEVEWETKIDLLKVSAGVGVDILNGATPASFNLKLDHPLATGLTVSADLQQAAYKFNSKTIENQVSAFRYGPSIFWQIDKDTSLFSSLKLGSYSDSNQETQSFSRIERKFGEFSIAGNLFSWSYQNSTDKGYFAPPDFLVYAGEVAWEGNVIRDFLKCRLSASIGGQNVNANSSDASGYQSKCTAKISPNVEADLGYSFSNIKSTVPITSIANSQSVTAQIRVKF